MRGLYILTCIFAVYNTLFFLLQLYFIYYF